MHRDGWRLFRQFVCYLELFLPSPHMLFHPSFKLLPITSSYECDFIYILFDTRRVTVLHRVLSNLSYIRRDWHLRTRPETRLAAKERKYFISPGRYGYYVNSAQQHWNSISDHLFQRDCAGYPTKCWNSRFAL